MALLRPHMGAERVLPSPGRTGTVQAMPYVRSERMALAIRLPSYPLSRLVRRVPRRANMQVSSLHKYRVPARLHRRSPVRHRAHPHRMWNTVLTPSGSRRSWPYRMATRHLCECKRTETLRCFDFCGAVHPTGRSTSWCCRWRLPPEAVRLPPGAVRLLPGVGRLSCRAASRAQHVHCFDTVLLASHVGARQGGWQSTTLLAKPHAVFLRLRMQCRPPGRERPSRRRTAAAARCSSAGPLGGSPRAGLVPDEGLWQGQSSGVRGRPASLAHLRVRVPTVRCAGQQGPRPAAGPAGGEACPRRR